MWVLASPRHPLPSRLRYDSLASRSPVGPCAQCALADRAENVRAPSTAPPCPKSGGYPARKTSLWRRTWTARSSSTTRRRKLQHFCPKKRKRAKTALRPGRRAVVPPKLLLLLLLAVAAAQQRTCT